MVGFVVDAFGTAVGVECEPQDRDRLVQQWGRCLTDREAVTTVTHAGGELVNASDYSLASNLTVAAITAQAGKVLMLHACGLADQQTGKVAVLVAESGTGKTTASMRLSQAGLGYVSDETIAIDEDLSVRAYPKPLSVVDDPAFPYEKSQHSPDDLGMARLPRLPLEAGMLVLLDRDRDGGSEPRLAAVDLVDGLVRLIPQTSALPSMKDPLAGLARTVTSLGGIFELTYSEIHEAKHLLVDALQTTPTQVHATLEHHPPIEELRSSTPPVPRDAPEVVTRVRRAPYVDAIADDGRVLLLAGTSCLVLDGPGAVLWCAAERELAIEDAVVLCQEALGDHPDAATLVRDAAAGLISHGVLLTDSAPPPVN